MAAIVAAKPLEGGTQSKEGNRQAKQSRREKEEREMRGWKGLEVAETIFEEDDNDEEDWSGSPTSPLSCSPPPPPLLESIVEAWSKVTGCKSDVIVRVQDRCFHLHRDPLISHSRYLKRKLAETSDITVTPPSGITAATFAAAVRFCYSDEVALTPSNFAAIWVAAEWLEMAATGGESLVQLTEDYFRREVAADGEKAVVVLKECVGLLRGAAKEAAGLAVRCVEVVANVEGGGDEGWLEDMVAVSAGEFQAVAEAMGSWFVHDHDLLYRIVDHYLLNHKGKMTEEDKIRICYTVNCGKLSHHLLVHLVQNPRLPLRFVVQAMLVDQTHNFALEPPAAPLRCDSSQTLGAIIRRDSAQRQAAHIRATMEATALRIESLERDLAGLRRRLRWSEEKRVEIESERSESFRMVQQESEVAQGAGAVEKSCNGSLRLRSGRSFGRKLVHGLKSMFRTSAAAKVGGESRVSTNDEVVDGEVEGGEERRAGQRRNRSLG